MNALAEIFSTVLSASWHVSWLIVVVLLVRITARHRIPAQLLFAAWIIVALGLLIPFGIPVRWSPFNLTKPIQAMEQTVMRPASEPVPDVNVPLSEPVTNLTEAPQFTPPVSRLTTREIVMLAWLAGVVGLVGIRLWASRNFRRRLGSNRNTGEARLQKIITQQSRRLGLKSPPAVLVSDAVNNPALFGLFRSCLIFPAGFAERLADDELRLVVLHELGHWRRRDLLAQALIQCAQVVHWFNPLVWLARRLSRLDCELACDEFVLCRTPPAETQTYGATLLKVLGVGHRQNHAPAILGVLENKQDLKRRIRMISEYQNPSLARTLTGVALLALLAVACATREAWAQLPAKVIVDQPASPASPGVPPAPGAAFDSAAAKGLLLAPSPVALPVSNATHIAFVIDASGSMRDPRTDHLWAAVTDKLDEVLKTAPQLQFFQIYDVDGRTVLDAPAFPGPWVPNRPDLVAAAEQVVRSYAVDNTSNPTPGILRALRAIKDSNHPDQRAGIWVLGDEFSSKDLDAAVARIDEQNPVVDGGGRQATINALAFPTWSGALGGPTSPHFKYAFLLSDLARRSDGVFVLVSSTEFRDGSKSKADPGVSNAPTLREAQKQKMEQVLAEVKTDVQERLAQERAYQQERAKKLKADSEAMYKLNTELHDLDSLRQFSRLIEAAEQAANKGEFTAAVRFYNDAMTIKPADLPVSETIGQLKATLQAQSVPVEITVTSDRLTFVSIANFKQLGQLETTTLKIPPGNYEIVGRRQGYQEVRLPLQVRDGAPPPAVVVACTLPVPPPPQLSAAQKISEALNDDRAKYVAYLRSLEKFPPTAQNEKEANDSPGARHERAIQNLIMRSGVAVDDVQSAIAPHVSQLQRTSQNEEEYNDRLEVLYEETIQDLIARHEIATEAQAGGQGVISVNKEGVISVNGAVVTDDQLLAMLQKLHDINQNVPILIMADETTPLKQLAFVMDTCRKAGLNKFSLQSR